MDLRQLSRSAASAKRGRQRALKEGVTFAGRKVWSEQENALVRLHYPDYAQLQKLLPERTPIAIKHQASALGVAYKAHRYTGGEVAKLRRMYPKATREELLEHFPFTNRYTLQRYANSHGFRRDKKPYKPTGYVELDEVRAKCFEIKWTMVDLDRAAGTKRFYRTKGWNGYKRLPYKCLGKAVAALGGRISITWPDESE